MSQEPADVDVWSHRRSGSGWSVGAEHVCGHRMYYARKGYAGRRKEGDTVVSDDYMISC